MGIFSFLKDAGEKLVFAATSDAETAPEIPIPPVPPKRVKVTAATLHLHLRKLGLAPADLSVAFDDGTATLRGTAESSEQREKMVLATGNVAGVAVVEDDLHVRAPMPPALLYTVQPGDTLSRIAKVHYGDVMKYPVIFEANKPMLKDPDRIYPGQVLRIPPLRG